jgi:hypothetical protein
VAGTLGHVEVEQLGQGEIAFAGVPLVGGIMALRDLAQLGAGLVAGLLAGDRAVGAEHEAPGTAVALPLQHVLAHARGVDAHAEPAQLVIPNELVTLARPDGVHRSLGQSRHRIPVRAPEAGRKPPKAKPGNLPRLPYVALEG